MIIIFDMFETVIDDVTIDFNAGLLSLWEKYYQDKCSFDEIKAYGEELFDYMMELHGKGIEFPFVKDELPLYAKKFGGDVVKMDVEEEADFLMRCNRVKVPEGLAEMLESFWNKNIPMYVLSNSGFTAGALAHMLNDNGIGSYFEKVWSSADFGRLKPDKAFFEMAVNEALKDHPGNTIDEILFVGDTYKTDVCGAYQAGLKVAWINRKNETDVNGFATYQISSVTELAELINL